MQRPRVSPFQELGIGSIGQAAAIPKALTIFLQPSHLREGLTSKII